MYIIIPLTIAITSLLGMSVIVWRKLPYLKKLTPEVIPGSFLQDMAPEIKGLASRMNWKEYKENFLLDVEKFLRRLRLFFLKIDSVSEALIKRIRKSHLGQPLMQESKPTVPMPRLEDAAVQVKGRKTKKTSFEDLKIQEQNLIMQIAKSPKDVTLYIALGEIYMKMQNFQDAKEAFETALRLDEENENASNRLDKAISKMGSA